MPWLGHGCTCLGWDAVIQHVLVVTQFYDMPRREAFLWVVGHFGLRTFRTGLFPK